jgi:hypothetical protein
MLDTYTYEDTGGYGLTVTLQGSGGEINLGGANNADRDDSEVILIGTREKPFVGSLRITRIDGGVTSIPFERKSHEIDLTVPRRTDDDNGMPTTIVISSDSSSDDDGNKGDDDDAINGVKKEPIVLLLDSSSDDDNDSKAFRFDSSSDDDDGSKGDAGDNKKEEKKDTIVLDDDGGDDDGGDGIKRALSFVLRRYTERESRTRICRSVENKSLPIGFDVLDTLEPKPICICRACQMNFIIVQSN